MANQPQSMKAVVATLRQENAPALLDLLELHVAVGEMELGAQSLSAALRELAGESAQLAASPALPPSARLHALADYARSASSTAEAQAAALKEIRRGLDAWNLT